MLKKSNVQPFRTSRDLWIAWMRNEEQDFDEPYLQELHEKVMEREKKRNLKPVDFFYVIEYDCDKKRIEKVRVQLTTTIKILFNEIARVNKSYNFHELKGKIDHDFKDGVYKLYIQLQSLMFVEDLISTLLCDAQVYEQTLGIKVLKIQKVDKLPES